MVWTTPSSLLRCAGLLLTALFIQGCANTTSGGAIGLNRSQLLIVSSDTVNAQAAKGFQQLTADARSKQSSTTMLP